MLGLAVGIGGTHGQLHSAFRAPYLLYQDLPIRGYLTRYPEGVGVYRHSARVVAGLTHHAHCLVDVRLRANKVKDVCKDVKIPLNLDRPHRRNQAAISIEVYH